MEASVYNIQRFCLHDGNGIRTTIFFKGCPLRCAWCSNPESQNSRPELMYNRHLCLGCGGCVAACSRGALAVGMEGLSIDRERCAACGNCAAACHTNALRLAGKIMPVDEIVEKSLADRSYYQNSSGGVTLSGGEPLAQAESAIRILAELKARRIHTTVESCGFVDLDVLGRAVPHVDQFIIDYKLDDGEKHRRFTGACNTRIHAALRHLRDLGASIQLRLPLIPGVNMEESHYTGVCDLINDLRLRQVEILPFHQYGKGKYEELGLEYRCADILPPAKDIVNEVKVFLSNNTSAIIC